MPEQSSIGVAVIGLGFMGRTHLSAYHNAAVGGIPCHVAAVCDADPQRLEATAAATGNLPGTIGYRPLFDRERTATYTKPEDLLANPEVQLVSVCTYTDSHVALATKALEAGKHVLVEKPVALAAADIRRLAEVAASAGRICMPGMCMRFWPEWAWLRETIRSGAFGPVRSATFQRLATPPRWGLEFFRDVKRSGGALMDLHIHDADFVYWCFGRPRSVSSTGTVEHLTTLYEYPSGPPHVVAEGGWDHTPGFGFKMRYTVVFESATADFDFSRHNEPLILHRGDSSEAVHLSTATAYEAQARHVLRAVGNPALPLTATLAEAADVAELLDAERSSMESGQPIRP